MATTELATIEKRLEQQGASALARARAFVIIDAHTADEVAAHRRWCKEGEEGVDADLDRIRRDAHATWKEIVAKVEERKQPYRQAGAWCGQLLAAWDQEQTRLRREAEAAQARERERLEAEERARVAAETERRRREEEDRRLEMAAQAEARGDTATAERIISAPVEIDAPAPRPVFVPPVQAPEYQRPAGTSYPKRWVAELENLGDLIDGIIAEQVPREVALQMLSYNGTKADAFARATSGSIKVPGVAFKQVTTTRQTR